MKSYGAALLVLLVALVAGACGGAAPEAQPPRPTDQPAIAGAPAGFNADDVAFATAMATSYSQTSALTALVPERSRNSGLIALAAEVDVAQRPELETVKVFLVQWNSNSDTDVGPGAGAQNGAVQGTVDDATLARLNSLSGTEFDTLWLQSMVGHAQGAIAVAHTEISRGSNVDALATAKRTVTAQQAEVDRMQQLLTGS